MLRKNVFKILIILNQLKKSIQNLERGIAGGKMKVKNTLQKQSSGDVL